MAKGNFIWLGSQKHDHNAMFMTIHGAPLRRDDEGKNRWILVRGKINIDDFENAKLRITCDGKYKLWLNDAVLGYGPYRSIPDFQLIDEYDVSLNLVKGINQISALIHLPGQDLAWYETIKSAWQKVFGDGGFYCEIETTNGLETQKYYAGESFKIIQSNAWNSDTELEGWGQDFIEDIDGDKIDKNWFTKDFNDESWPNAQYMIAKPDENVRARGWGDVVPFRQKSIARVLPLKREIIYPSRIIWAKYCECDENLPLKQRIFQEQFEKENIENIKNLDELTKGKTQIILNPKLGKDIAILLEFDPYIMGRPFIEIEGEGGEFVDMVMSEALPGEFGIGEKGDGLRHQGKLYVSHIFRQKLIKGQQHVQKFNQTGIRALQIIIRGAKSLIKILQIGLEATYANLDHKGDFKCEIPLLNKIWSIGRHTLQMCAQDGWVDCPGREQRQWLGDGIVMFDMAKYAFGPSIFPMHNLFLEQISQGQRSDGLARMVSPGDIKSNSITIPDYSLHYINGMNSYIEAGGDLEFLKSQMPSMEKAINWFIRLQDETGLICDIPEWHFIEWADIEREGYSLPINALFAQSLKTMEKLYREFGYINRADEFAANYNKVKSAINKYHFDEKRKIYVDSVNVENLSRGLKISQHANSLAILYDIAPKEYWNEILAQITDEDRLKLTNSPPIMENCPEFNVQNDIVRANSFFSHFVYDGIAKAGGIDWVINDIQKQYGPMIEQGTTCLWEGFEPIASLCHGFSAAPVYILSKYCLGIIAHKNGFEEFSLDIQVTSLKSVSGIVPTPYGNIEISWKKMGDEYEIHICRPIKCKFINPNISNYKIEIN